MPSIRSVAVALLAVSAQIVSAAAVASPAADVAVSEVIPGEGLPSLSSLGVTSDDLYKEKFEASAEAKEALAAAAPPTCVGTNTARVEDVIACFNYLQRLGNRDCVVPASGRVGFCRAGTAYIYGSTRNGRSQRTTCSNIAIAVQGIFTRCNSGGRVDGNAIPTGNGNIRVVAGGRR
ncbi:MAG: hypothetical protein M1814_006512 [Vezdaea aestivalis]|nr:MAG: hypothetical protein M1814_006512 [Vezdaea aestivalis]